MPDNVLTLQGSKEYRDFLLTKNLPPYTIENSFAPNGQGLGQVTNLTSTVPSNVIDSQALSDDVYDEAQSAIVFNKYGPTEILDGAELISQPTTDLTVTQTEYIGGDVVEKNQSNIDIISVLNRFNPENGYADLFIVTDNILVKDGFSGTYPKFNQQSYNLIDIINQNNDDVKIKSGNGQDSYLQQLGLKFLKNLFQVRIDEQIRKNTIGRVNLDAFTNPYDIAALATGREKLVQKNWNITVPDGVFDQAKYLTQKLLEQ